jgi:eukaryotic-like serine/threonine-protein kinase
LLEPGDQIDIWVIDQRLGSGGMGSVYRAHNQAARRILAAVKILEGHIARHPEARARFIREAEILFTLEHPNIVKVRNVRVDGEHPYIEMEFVEGESIEDRLARDGGLPLAEALPLMAQIASAVAYLHRRGIRHRDIKPANILIREGGQAKLVDFGLAMEADATRLTQGDMSFGTVSYAPPEWVDPERLDPVRWDLYAMGVVFWEMLTGAVAFPVSGEGDARQQAFQVILKKQSHPPLDPGEGVPEPVRALIRDLTAHEPEARLSDAAEVVARLEALEIGRAHV